MRKCKECGDIVKSEEYETGLVDFCSCQNDIQCDFDKTRWVLVTSYRDFSIECSNNGTRIEEKCFACSHELLMCKKYGGQCISSKCRKERINDSRTM